MSGICGGLATAEKIEELLQLKYPEIYNWVPSEFYDGIGPNEQGVIEQFSANRDDWFELARKKLSLSIASAVDLAIAELRISNQTKSIPAINKVFVELGQLRPLLWWSAGFSVENHRADFEYWVQMDEWGLDDAFALSVGFEPEALPLELAANFGMSSEVQKFAQRRRNLIENKFFKFGRNTLLKPSPKVFCEWALDVKLEIPAELLEAHNKMRDTKFRSLVPMSGTVAKIDNREKASMLKLIIGLAVNGYGYGYGYDVNSERSPIPNQICSDLALLGISLHADTVRAYFKGTNQSPAKR